MGWSNLGQLDRLGMGSDAWCMFGYWFMYIINRRNGVEGFYIKIGGVSIMEYGEYYEGKDWKQEAEKMEGKDGFCCCFKGV
ncbi:hypothetical protein HanXRQr2_Chr08g0360181 [Helianthus annuus]|uniref:Uncharacterized protein n=1 Tax=Helianthus annuus TaxID=4232 RepID=A0A9K3IHJ2_HELAN|nr:hypothetical protein HanXRQr2_Chr08g0360181 [Helianthus annuus]KAJ0903315.1 hypothetical protein HanPSC8_Chr08g0347661 [Helianthus annuus]